MADVLGTGPERKRVGGLARRFRLTGTQEDLDNLKAGIELFEEAAAEKVRQDAAAAEKTAEPE